MTSPVQRLETHAFEPRDFVEHLTAALHFRHARQKDHRKLLDLEYSFRKPLEHGECLRAVERGVPPANGHTA